MRRPSRGAIEALIRRNAEACERAVQPRCKCACGGVLHGGKHSAAWQSSVVQLALRAQATADQATLDTLGVLDLMEPSHILSGRPEPWPARERSASGRMWIDAGLEALERLEEEDSR